VSEVYTEFPSCGADIPFYETVDAWFVVTGQVPAPAYSMPYFLGGVTVGVGALLMLVVAVLGFTDAKRFQRPWGPRVVHSFTYAGFAFGTIHAAAIGTDLRDSFVPCWAPRWRFLCTCSCCV